MVNKVSVTSTSIVIMSLWLALNCSTAFFVIVPTESLPDPSIDGEQSFNLFFQTHFFLINTALTLDASCYHQLDTP